MLQPWQSDILHVVGLEVLVRTAFPDVVEADFIYVSEVAEVSVASASGAQHGLNLPSEATQASSPRKGHRGSLGDLALFVGRIELEDILQ